MVGTAVTTDVSFPLSPPTRTLVYRRGWLRLGGVRQRCHGAVARPCQMQATHDGGLGARGGLAAAAARSSTSPAGGADARAAARRGGRRNTGHAARGWRPGRAPGAEAAHGSGPPVPGVSAPRELRRGASRTNKAGRRGLGSLLRSWHVPRRSGAVRAGRDVRRHRPRRGAVGQGRAECGGFDGYSVRAWRRDGAAPGG